MISRISKKQLEDYIDELKEDCHALATEYISSTTTFANDITKKKWSLKHQLIRRLEIQSKKDCNEMAEEIVEVKQTKTLIQI
tara:strand:- start:335 stop:580 length:246 start_codon:yes stop_codon:yes gene_type:complete